MKKLTLKILFFPLLILWVLLVPLFKLLNKYYPDAQIWNYKGVFLIDTSRDIHLKIHDETEGSKSSISIYSNQPAGNKKFISIISKNYDIDTKVYLNTELSNLEISKDQK